MTDLITAEEAQKLLDHATSGRRVQFHGSYCPEAVGTPFTDWDTSHEMSVIRPDGSRYRLASYKHAMDAYMSQMAPGLARTVIALHAELAQARADAKAAVAVPVAWKYRWKIDGEYVGWRYSDASNAHPSLDGYEEQPLYSAPADTEAAVALAVARAARGVSDLTHWIGDDGHGTTLVALQEAITAIRALSPEDAIAEVERMRAERDEALADVARFQEERTYVIGANDGWDAAVEQGEASPAVGKAMVRFWKKLAETHNERADRLAAELTAANAREAGLRNFVEDFAAAKIDALRFPRPLSPEDEPDPVVDAEEVWAWQADARAIKPITGDGK